MRPIEFSPKDKPDGAAHGASDASPNRAADAAECASPNRAAGTAERTSLNRIADADGCASPNRIADADGCASPGTASGASDATRNAAPKPQKRAKRDPEGRKRAIVEAAADLIMHGDGTRLTHRRVAAHAGVPLGSTTQYFASIEELRRAGMAALAEQVERDYDAMFADIARKGGTAEALADAINEYLMDRDQIDADAAYYSASVTDPEVRKLARKAFISMVERLLPYASEAQAVALAAFIDGVTLDTHILGTPIDPEAVRIAVIELASPRKDA